MTAAATAFALVATATAPRSTTPVAGAVSRTHRCTPAAQRNPPPQLNPSEQGCPSCRGEL